MSTTDWTDRTNLALDAIQVVQLRSIQRHLAGLHTLEAQALHTIAEQAQLRELVIKFEGLAETLSSSVSTAPIAAFALTVASLRQIESSNLSTGRFAEFADKDRCKKLVSSFEAVKESSQLRLSSQEITLAYEVAGYLEDQPRLYAILQRKRELANPLEARQALNRKRAEIRSLGKHIPGLPVASRLMMVPAVCTFFPGAVGVLLGLVLLSDSNSFALGVKIGALSLLLVCAGMGFIYIGHRLKPQRRIQWEKLATEEAALRQVYYAAKQANRGTVAEIADSRFAGHTLERLEALYAEREAFLKQVFSPGDGA